MRKFKTRKLILETAVFTVWFRSINAELTDIKRHLTSLYKYIGLALRNAIGLPLEQPMAALYYCCLYVFFEGFQVAPYLASYFSALPIINKILAYIPTNCILFFIYYP